MPQVQAFWNDNITPGGNGFGDIWTAFRQGPNSWTPKTLFYSCVNNPPAIPPGFNPAHDGFEGFSASPNLGKGVLGSLDKAGGGEELYFITSAATPVPIDNTLNPDVQDFFSVSQGPWIFGGKLWVIGALGSTHSALAVYASADGGNTWAIQDSAHQPTGLPSNNAGYAFYWDGSSNLIRCIVLTSMGTFSLIEFNMSTALWGAAHDPVSPASVGKELRLIVDATGTVYFFYSASPHAYVSYLSGGVWTTDVQVDTLTTPNGPNGIAISQAILDPNGTTIHIPYAAQDRVFPFPIYGFYIAMTAPGVFANAHAFPQNGGMDSLGNTFGRSLISNGALLLATDWLSGAPNSAVWPSVWVGSPLSAPAWPVSLPEFIDNNPSDNATCVFLSISSPVTELVLSFKGIKVYPQS